MTTVYFLRHAQPDYSTHQKDVEQAPLTSQGRIDAEQACVYFEDKHIDAIFSSPYPRAIDTVAPLACQTGLQIQLIEDIRERKVGAWVEDFTAFSRQQWEDFNYALPGGENLNDVQQRSVSAFERVLNDYPDETLVIGGHGTSISTILNYYDPAFNFSDFERIKNWMPWIVRLTFDGMNCVEVKDVFWLNKTKRTQ